MAKRITTSAQKTVHIGKAGVLDRLRQEVSDQESLRFEPTSNPDVHAARLADGSRLLVAAFDKGDGRSVAMIDHQGVAEDRREKWHAHWRRTIDRIFE